MIEANYSFAGKGANCMTMKQITVSPGVIRFFSDLEEAYDRDPDGLADMLGYNFERLDDRLCELRIAINKGTSVRFNATHTLSSVVSTSTPVVSTSKPVVSTSTPVISTSKPVVPTSTPVADTSKPVA